MTPRISFILLSYNQESTAEQAATCALAQDYPNLQVIFSDDCSPDNTFTTLQASCKAYTGPHEVRLLRTEKNGGLVRNLENALTHATGALVIIAAADDLSHPQRATRLADAWTKAGMPRSAVVYSNVRPINADGVPIIDWNEKVVEPPFSLEQLAEGSSGPLGAGCAITPNLINEPQPIDPRVVHEDRVFPFRAILLGGAILFVHEPLVDYRVQGGISRQQAKSRWETLTHLTANHMRRVLPDARQRLADAELAHAPKHVLTTCQQLISEQEAYLAMADGTRLIAKGFRAFVSGARPTKIAVHLLRFLRAAATVRT